MKFGNILIGKLFLLVLIAYAAIGYDLVTHTYGWYIWVPIVFVALERCLLQFGLWLTQKMAEEAMKKLLGGFLDGA